MACKVSREYFCGRFRDVGRAPSRAARHSAWGLRAAKGLHIDRLDSGSTAAVFHSYPPFTKLQRCQYPERGEVAEVLWPAGELVPDVFHLLNRRASWPGM